jgi:hypothetical protein
MSVVVISVSIVATALFTARGVGGLFEMVPGSIVATALFTARGVGGLFEMVPGSVSADALSPPLR